MFVAASYEGIGGEDAGRLSPLVGSEGADGRAVALSWSLCSGAVFIVCTTGFQRPPNVDHVCRCSDISE